MPEIYHFNIYRADAVLNDNESLRVRLFYASNPKPITSRLKENLPFGVSTLERLLKEGCADLANGDNPFKPAAVAAMYVLNDGKIICNRRDKEAPTHPLYHSIHGGYPQTKEEIYTAKGLEDAILREIAEECLLITNDKKPWLIVPNDAKKHTLWTAKNLGLNLPLRYIDVETLASKDTLEVYDESENLIFKLGSFIDIAYESQTNLNVQQVRLLPVSSDEVSPIDAEGMIKSGKFLHFNRESYIIDQKEIENREFGSVMQSPEVYRTRIDGGIPKLFVPSYELPYLGPDKVLVASPHIWAPDNILVVGLDALAVAGFKGKKLEIELWKERMKFEGKSLIPKDSLAN